MTPKEYLSNSSFCPLPWTAVYVSPDGSINNCCLQPSKPALGNINQMSISDAVNGSENRNRKNTMLSGNNLPECKNCYKFDDQSISKNSARTDYLKKLSSIPLSTYDQDSNFELSVLDFRFRNTCNLACVYCSPTLSSKWANEMKSPIKIYNEDNLSISLEYLNKNLKNLKHVYLAGGEPMMIKENLLLLKRLYEVNPDVSLRVNTNLTIIDNEIFNTIIKFKNIEWIVSVESTHEQFEYIRYHAVWDEFVSNLVKLKSLGNKITFNMVWFTLSSFSIFKTIDFLLEMGFDQSEILVTIGNYPDWIDIRHLHVDKLNKIKLELDSRMQNITTNQALYKNYQNMVDYLKKPFDRDPDLLYNALHAIDSRRKLNSKLIFQEIF